MEERNELIKDTRTNRTSEPELLRVVDAAKLLSLSRSKVYEMTEKGEIPVVRIGTAVRIPRKKLLAWLDENTAMPVIRGRADR